MKTQLHLGRGAAIVACAASLVATAAVAPTAASARGASSCPNKTIAIQIEGGSPVHLPIKMFTVEGGVSCAEAYKVIAGVMNGKPPTGWKPFPAQFKTPEGLFPQGVKNGGKKIKFATRGG